MQNSGALSQERAKNTILGQQNMSDSPRSFIRIYMYAFIQTCTEKEIVYRMAFSVLIAITCRFFDSFVLIYYIFTDFSLKLTYIIPTASHKIKNVKE